MKKCIAVALLSLIFLCSKGLSARSSVDAFTVSMQTGGGWGKAKDGAWVGKDMKCYKIDPNGKMMISRDMKNWVPAPNSMWQDKSGRWLTLEGKVLKQSTDKVSWSTVKDAKWVGGNGRTYKFDKDMSVLEMGGSSKAPAPKKKTK